MQDSCLVFFFLSLLVFKMLRCFLSNHKSDNYELMDWKYWMYFNSLQLFFLKLKFAHLLPMVDSSCCLLCTFNKNTVIFDSLHAFQFGNIVHAHFKHVLSQAWYQQISLKNPDSLSPLLGGGEVGVGCGGSGSEGSSGI